MAIDSLPYGTTGLAASLHVRYRDSTGKVYNVATGLAETWADANYADYKYVGDLAEDGTSGNYNWTTPTAVANWPSYSFTVHRNVGGTPSTDPQIGEGEEEGTTEVQTGTSLSPTRPLHLYHFGPAGTLVDTVGTPTLEVTRQDNAAVVVAAGTAMTRIAAGVYRYTLAETGLVYNWTASYVYPAGAPQEKSFVSFPLPLHYATTAGVFKKLGEGNARLIADLNNADSATDQNEAIDDAVAEADSVVNLILATASPPPAQLATGTLVTSTHAWVNRVISDAANLIAAGILINKREQDRGVPEDQRAGNGRINDGKAMLTALVANGLSGVELEEEDETPGAGQFSFVPINRDVCESTSDENTRPMLWY